MVESQLVSELARSPFSVMHRFAAHAACRQGAGADALCVS
jgi:hypothetical protein